MSPIRPRHLPFARRSIALGLALAVALPGLAFAAPAVALSSAAQPAGSSNSAIRPEPRPGGWMKRHDAFLAEAKQERIDVLFLGDSITDFWRDPGPKRGGRAVWDREFAPLHAANFGISGDRTQHVLWRLDHGEVDGLHPKVVVLMIGTNNTGYERDKVTLRNTPDQTIAGITAVVRELRSKLPDSKILLLAIFPRGQNPHRPDRAQIALINEAISQLADGQTIRFLDLGPKFLNPDGTLSPEVMPDFLHPSEKGYEIWAAAMKPTLLALLGKR